MRKLIRKINDYLYNTYLPKVTKETYLNEINSLRKAFAVQPQQIAELKAYINGTQDAMRSIRTRIEVNNEVSK